MGQLCCLIRALRSGQGLGGTGCFVRWSQRGESEHRLHVVFGLLWEVVAWRCGIGGFDEQFRVLPLELGVKFI